MEPMPRPTGNSYNAPHWVVPTQEAEQSSPTGRGSEDVPHKGPPCCIQRSPDSLTKALIVEAEGFEPSVTEVKAPRLTNLATPLCFVAGLGIEPRTTSL